MFLKANISARTADASEWWRVQIQNEVIKTEHAQNSLWYLNSCRWNPVQELHWVTMQFHKPSTTQAISTAIRRNTQHSSTSSVPPATTAFPMSGKQPIRCKQGQSQNSDLMFHIQLLSWENENCYRYYRQLLVGGQLSGSGGLNVSVPPGRISFPSEFGPARSGSAGSGNLWLRLNQFRAASESWGKQSASRAGMGWGRRQFNRENDNP